MKGDTRLVAVKLTPTEHAVLEQLVSWGYFKSLSAAIRTALMELYEKHKLKLEARDNIKIERLHHPMRRNFKRNKTGDQRHRE